MDTPSCCDSELLRCRTAMSLRQGRAHPGVASPCADGACPRGYERPNETRRDPTASRTATRLGSIHRRIGCACRYRAFHLMLQCRQENWIKLRPKKESDKRKSYNQGRLIKCAPHAHSFSHTPLALCQRTHPTLPQWWTSRLGFACLAEHVYLQLWMHHCLEQDQGSPLGTVPLNNKRP